MRVGEVKLDFFSVMSQMLMHGYENDEKIVKKADERMICNYDA